MAVVLVVEDGIGPVPRSAGIGPMQPKDTRLVARGAKRRRGVKVRLTGLSCSGAPRASGLDREQLGNYVLFTF
jgi:hypothetical protein